MRRMVDKSEPRTSGVRDAFATTPVLFVAIAVKLMEFRALLDRETALGGRIEAAEAIAPKVRAAKVATLAKENMAINR